MKAFQIIGGQYESHFYGEADSLRGAKVIAARNEEYWDNWGGWKRPAIYRAEDVEEIESRGRITTPDGWKIRVPKAGTAPAAVWNGKKWEEA